MKIFHLNTTFRELLINFFGIRTFRETCYFIKNISESFLISWAARRGYLSIVKLLLDRGIDVNAIDNSNGTALYWAARRGYLSIVKLLLDRGADIDITDMFGQTAYIFSLAK